MQDSKDKDANESRQSMLWRLCALLLAVILLTTSFFVLGLDQYMTLQALQHYRHDLMKFVEISGAVSVLLFIAVYAAATLLSLPGGTILTILGGFLFGALWGSIWVIIGATLGATGIFLLARSGLAPLLRNRAGRSFEAMEAGFKKNAFNYLLFLRLAPVFPFVLINIAPAFLGVPARTYILATLLGIIPGTAIFAMSGAGLGMLLEKGKSLSIQDILTPEISFALVGLAILSLLPVLFGHWKNRCKHNNA